MIGEIILIFCIITIISIVLFTCICMMGCMKIASLITPSIIKFASSKHDKPYALTQEPINNQCFICLQKISNEVVASCNHSFCCECIVKYTQVDNSRPINCPACRKQIIILFRRFNNDNDEQNICKNIVCEYNYKYSQEPGFFRAIKQFGNNIRHLPLLLTQNGLRYLLSDYRLRYILLLIIYGLSPIDILPQALLGPLGLFDDGIALAVIVRQITAILYGFIRQQINRN